VTDRERQTELPLFAKPAADSPKPVATPQPAEKPPRAQAAPLPSVQAPRAPTASQPTAQPAEPEVLSVARLDRMLKRMLETSTAEVRVRGEISGLARPASGHLYFSLKDETEDALIEAVMYKTARPRAKAALKEGERVVLIGRVTVYPPRGRMQFVADDVLETGRGALLEALEKLKAKLAAEGLFAPERKRALPSDPRVIAVLTSPAGAAIHDVVRVAFRRGKVRILLVPTPVQGASAADRIAEAIALTDRLAGVDAMIVTRGGGSLEDLSAYNDERVVRAIARARTVVVSAVGHEIDVTLSDLAADARAATPSQAAELLVPDFAERALTVAHWQARLGRAVRHAIAVRQAQLLELRPALGEPRRALLEQEQRIDELSARLERSMRRRLAARRAHLEALYRRLDTQHPRQVIARARVGLLPLEPRLRAAARERLRSLRTLLGGYEPSMRAALREQLRSLRAQVDGCGPRLQAGIREQLRPRQRQMGAATARLEALSPLAVLRRGYAIATTADGRAISDAAQVEPGDPLALRLHRGRLGARVETTERARPDDDPASDK